MKKVLLAASVVAAFAFAGTSQAEVANLRSDGAASVVNEDLGVQGLVCKYDSQGNVVCKFVRDGG